MQPINVGIIGAGNVSSQYLNAAKFFPSFQITALADIDLARAKARAEEYGVAKASSVEDLLADDTLDLIINLTIPSTHVAVSQRILEAGKSVYSEKPLGTVREEAEPLLKLAKGKNLRIGCAPDTFLGAGLQTSRKVIDDGWIGEPLGATAFMMGRGMEMWHPDPYFFYQPGAGPLFDVGVYYVTALVHLLGPVAKVAATAKTTFPERLITSQPLFGTKIPVGTPTHISSLLSFESGTVGTLMASFDVWASEVPRIEIYGSEGTLSVPDPNTFGGPVSIKRAGASEWSTIPLTHGYTENSRGLGVADMAHALTSGRKHRASGDLAYHVLDIMQSILEAAEAEKTLAIKSSTERPAAFPLGLVEGILDE